MKIQGILFRSGKEAKRWISLLMLQEAGHVRNLKRQVRYPLETVRPDGLIQVVAHYVADFVYEERVDVNAWAHGFREVVEDTKPGGFKKVRGKLVPFREEVYLLKKKWFEAQYGIAIRET